MHCRVWILSSDIILRMSGTIRSSLERGTEQCSVLSPHSQLAQGLTLLTHSQAWNFCSQIQESWQGKQGWDEGYFWVFRKHLEGRIKSTTFRYFRLKDLKSRAGRQPAYVIQTGLMNSSFCYSTTLFFLSANVIYRLIRQGSGKVSDAANITKGMVPPDAAWLTVSILQLF